jgi:hypothetical protein
MIADEVVSGANGVFQSLRDIRSIARVVCRSVAVRTDRNRILDSIRTALG